ncbi:MAG: galactose mutarotase [Bacteroides sp.]|nr:galactose mutarotase [Bacteroides sp.]
MFLKDFQREVEGQLTDLYVLRNRAGMEVCITNYGGRVVSIMAPDRDGNFEDVVLGFPTIDEYVNQKQNFGAIIGRYIGRILNGRFQLDGEEYTLTPNTGPHSAHGGDPGFAARIWQAEHLDQYALKLSYLSVDGENGFPGNLRVRVVYRLTEDNELDILYEAETDKPTVVNLSHHSFFNISGDLFRPVEDQLLYVNAGFYTPYDSLKCVTGEIAPVTGSAFDFNHPVRIGNRIDEEILQLQVTGGYDHTWVLNTAGDETALAARVSDPQSGRTMEVYTNEPGLHIYTSNGLKGNIRGKERIPYPRRNSICLETMHFADSPNKPHFPSTRLDPGEVYRSRCIYRFGITAEE